MEIIEDNIQDKPQRVGIYGWIEQGFAILDNRIFGDNWRETNSIILEYSNKYPEHTRLFYESLWWLYKEEPSWRLEEKIDKREYCEELLDMVSKKKKIDPVGCKHENLEEIDLDEVVRYKCKDCGYSWKEELPQ